MERILLLVQFATAFLMTGIIWLVQVVHYPLFSFVGSEKYREFHQSHMHLISFVVAPLMIIEAISAGLMLFYPPPNTNFSFLLTNVVLIAIIWFSTFFLQVPLHEKLAQGFDLHTHQSLVQTNWIRTAVWTLRAAFLLWLMWKAIR